MERTIEKLTVCAPIDGVITERKVEAAESVNLGAHLFTVADLSRTRIEAEVDECDIGRLALKAPVTIRAEAFPSAIWGGEAEEVPGTLRPKSLRPQGPDRPVDVGVLLVKIRLLEKTPLILGQRVEVEIDASSQQATADGHGIYY